MRASSKVARLAAGRRQGGRRRLCLIALVLAVAGCSAPTTSSPRPSNTTDSSAQAGRVAVQYATALFVGNVNIARSLVEPGSQQAFAVVAAGIVPNSVEARGLAVGRTAVTGDRAVATLLGDLCPTTPSTGSPKVTASADCLSNRSPTSENPIFKVALARQPNDQWLVTLTIPGQITPPVPPTPSAALVRVVATHDAPRAISVTEVIAGASTRAAAPSFASAVSVVTKCWSLNAYRVGKNILGGTLYTLHTKTNWCGDGSLIRTHAYTTTDATTVIGWKYYGLSQNTDSFGVNTGQFESIRVGQFCTLNCLIQNKHEYIDVKVGPSGQIFRS